MNWQQAVTGGLLGFLVLSIRATDALSLPNPISTATDAVKAVLTRPVKMAISIGGTTEEVNLSQVPQDVDITLLVLRETVQFKLYTVSNPRIPQKLYVNDDVSLASSYFNSSRPTRIVTHGWKNSAEWPACTNIRDAYLNHGDYNVIVVDWSFYSYQSYVSARSKISAIGKYIGRMINYLESKGMSLDDLVVVGHSLGAHIAGVGARSATNTVASVVGLDPAGPLFALESFSRMSAEDAEFVEVIHTNAGKLGHTEKLGDVDFWPNGGSSQPGCVVLDISGACSHLRAYLYFAESITADNHSARKKFIAKHCEDFSRYSSGFCTSNNSTKMGGSNLEANTRTGNYYLVTNMIAPFAKG